MMLLILILLLLIFTHRYIGTGVSLSSLSEAYADDIFSAEDDDWATLDDNLDLDGGIGSKASKKGKKKKTAAITPSDLEGEGVAAGLLEDEGLVQTAKKRGRKPKATASMEE